MAIMSATPRCFLHNGRPMFLQHAPRHHTVTFLRGCTSRAHVSSGFLQTLSDMGSDPTQEQPAAKKVRRSGATDELIAASIARSQLRRTSRPQYHCPACDQLVVNPFNLHEHLLGCCPDHVEAPAWAVVLSQAPPDSTAIMALLRSAHQQELELRDKALHLAFHCAPRDEDGNALRMEMVELARRLNLPIERTRGILRLAMGTIPIPSDAHEPVDVVFEDDHFLAVNKPVGVSTTPAHRYKGGTMLNRVIGYLGKEPFLLHRIDMNTSGLLLFAKTAEVARGVHRQFRERTLHKLYLAVAVGVPEEQAFRVDAPIERHPVLSIARMVGAAGKPARTDFAVIGANTSSLLSQAPGARRGMAFDSAAHALARARCDATAVAAAATSTAGGRASPSLLGPGAGLAPCNGKPVTDGWPGGVSLLACSPMTGRTHQIRVHAAHVGHSLVGDEVYGVEGPWISRQALHATAMAVTDPVTGRRLSLLAPPLEDFQKAAATCGLPCVDAKDAAELFEAAWRTRGAAYDSGASGRKRQQQPVC